MTRLLLTIALALATPLAAPASAQGVFVPPPPGVVGPRAELTGRRARVGRELQFYGISADMGRLSNRKVSLLDNALHGGRSHNDTRLRLQSILSGGGLLQRIIDRN